MACSNATGTHKLPHMFKGKAANPRCFKHVNKATLPVTYYNQKNAWVDANIFYDWVIVSSVIKHLTEHERGLPIKALLLLDNAPAHPDANTVDCKKNVATSRDSFVTSRAHESLAPSTKEKYYKHASPN